MRWRCNGDLMRLELGKRYFSKNGHYIIMPLLSELNGARFRCVVLTRDNQIQGFHRYTPEGHYIVVDYNSALDAVSEVEGSERDE